MKSFTLHDRLIFGLKLRQLRQAKDLSFAELAEKVSISISYLNEIEKGKKYPKEDKIMALAAALDTSYDELTSANLPKNLKPVSDLLESKFLNELPLDLFGIEPIKVIEIIADAPTKVGAFIATLLDIARNYEMERENFYFAALRSYQELNNNYFGDLERKVDSFTAEYRLAPNQPIAIDTLYKILRTKFQYEIDRHTLNAYPELAGFRSIFIKEKRKLLVNSNLTETQQAFLLGREIAFNYLQLHERVLTSNAVKVKSFQEALNNFKASYFAVALLINKDSLLADLHTLFLRPTWSADALLHVMNKYKSSPEMFFHRLTNLIPRFTGMDELFFLRFQNTPGNDHFILTKELHLTGKHQPHANAIQEHYCRRWISIWLLNTYHQQQRTSQTKLPIAGIQRSKFHDTPDEYLVFAIAGAAHPTPNTNISVAIGLRITPTLQKNIAFLNDPNIPVRTVNRTCERCPLSNCAERTAPPSIVQNDLRHQAIHDALHSILKNK
jgi:transcriptional regulator with XRE-family HTH domain